MNAEEYEPCHEVLDVDDDGRYQRHTCLLVSHHPGWHLDISTGLGWLPSAAPRRP